MLSEIGLSPVGLVIGLMANALRPIPQLFPTTPTTVYIDISRQGMPSAKMNSPVMAGRRYTLLLPVETAASIVSLIMDISRKRLVGNKQTITATSPSKSAKLNLFETRL